MYIYIYTHVFVHYTSPYEQHRVSLDGFRDGDAQGPGAVGVVLQGLRAKGLGRVSQADASTTVDDIQSTWRFLENLRGTLCECPDNRALLSGVWIGPLSFGNSYIDAA